MSKPVAFRLQDSTIRQLRELAEKLGTTLTQAIILAIDRAAREEERCRSRAKR